MQKTGIILLVIFSFGCHSGKGTDETVDEAVWLQRGDSVAGMVQAVLLANVMQAIKQNGAAGAVAFCNEKATYLTDSAGNHSVQRLSDKNRNPDNAILSETDRTAWDKLKERMQDSSAQKHFVSKEADGIYYFKAITLGMPACLQCHGEKEKDILPETLAVLQEKYPTDKATGYALGMLRGMWKIKITEE